MRFAQLARNHAKLVVTRSLPVAQGTRSTTTALHVAHEIRVILVPPGALSFEIHILGPMQDFTVEVWRLAALQFDGARVDEWLAGAEGTAFREGPGDDRAPQIGRVSVDIVERFAFLMEHRTP